MLSFSFQSALVAEMLSNLPAQFPQFFAGQNLLFTNIKTDVDMKFALLLILKWMPKYKQDSTITCVLLEVEV